MKWLKWHHKFSSGHQHWQWNLIDDDETEKSVRENVLAELADEYNHSEHYRGIDFEIIDHAPQWVVEMKINAVGDKITTLEQLKQKYLLLVPTCIDCQQCAGARAPTDEERRKRSYHEIEHCPTCGRELWAASLDFWLMPSDKAAVKLLGSLVYGGPRTSRSERLKPPVDDEKAYSRLAKLGLVVGSSYQHKYIVEASERGKVEWAKHKAARAKRPHVKKRAAAR